MGYFLFLYLLLTTNLADWPPFLNRAIIWNFALIENEFVMDHPVSSISIRTLKMKQRWHRPISRGFMPFDYRRKDQRWNGMRSSLISATISYSTSFTGRRAIKAEEWPPSVRQRLKLGILCFLRLGVLFAWYSYSVGASRSSPKAKVDVCYERINEYCCVSKC